MRRAAIVELQVPTTVLAALRPEQHGAWAPLLVELQQRLTELAATSTPGRPPDAHAGVEEWARRRAGAELDRWIRVRDRCCVGFSCRCPAHRVELDHTLARVLGGPTCSWNLGAWCKQRHLDKHRAGWQVSQPSPGRFVIRTRAGVTHIRAPKKITEPLPEPRPATRPRPLPDDGWPDPHADIDPDWFQKVAPAAAARAARRAKPVTPTPTATHDPDDTPPF